MLTGFLFALFLLLILLNVPIAFVLLSVSLIYVILKGVPFELVGHVMTHSINSFILIAIPFYILAAKLMEESKITDRLLDFCDDMVGWVKGGLGHVVVVSSMIFAGMTGSAVAEAGGLGNVELSIMKKAGYDDEFSVGIVASASTIGPIIPPSLFFILYGAICQVSVGKLFLAGAIPGVLMGISLMIRVYLHALKKEYPKRPIPRFKKLLRSTKRAFLPCMTPVLIMGGITSGIFTPTEAAVAACFYAFVLGKFVYGTLTWKAIYTSISYSVFVTAMVAFIIAVAGVYGWILTAEGITTGFSDFMLSVTSDKWIFLLIILGILGVMGMFIEEAAIMIMTLPIIYPLLKVYGVDPVHFGVVITLCLVLGMLTPPFGLLLFTLSAITKKPVDWVFKATYPYLIPLAMTLLFITFVPITCLWLPSLFFR